MLVFNRVLLILGSVVLAGLVAVLLLLPVVLVQAGEWIARLDAPVRLLLVVCLDLLILGLAVWRFWAMDDAGSENLVARVDGRRINVNSEAAAEKIRRAVLAVPAVVESDIAVRPVRGRADVRIDAWLDANSDDYAAKQRDILRQVERVVLKQMGLRFASTPTMYLHTETELQNTASVSDALTTKQAERLNETAAPLR